MICCCVMRTRMDVRQSLRLASLVPMLATFKRMPFRYVGI